MLAGRAAKALYLQIMLLFPADQLQTEEQQRVLRHKDRLCSWIEFVPVWDFEVH